MTYRDTALRGPCSECGEPSALILTVGDGPTRLLCGKCHGKTDRPEISQDALMFSWIVEKIRGTSVSWSHWVDDKIREWTDRRKR